MTYIGIIVTGTWVYVEAAKEVDRIGTEWMFLLYPQILKTISFL